MTSTHAGAGEPVEVYGAGRRCVESDPVWARAMLTAMIEDETDPLRLADMRKGKMRRKIPDLAQALTGECRRQPCPGGRLDAASAGPGRACHGLVGRGDRGRLQAVAASDRAAANHSRGRAEGRGGVHRRDRRRHVAVPDRYPFGGLGWFGGQCLTPQGSSV